MDTESSGNTTDKDQDQDQIQGQPQAPRAKTSRIRRQNIKRKYDKLNDEVLNSSLSQTSQVDGEEQPKKSRETKRRKSVPVVDPGWDLRQKLDLQRTKSTVSTVSTHSSNSNPNSTESSDSEVYESSRSTTSEEPAKTTNNLDGNNKSQTEETRGVGVGDEIFVDINPGTWNTEGIDLIDGNYNEDVDDRNLIPRRAPNAQEFYRTTSTPYVNKTNKKVTDNTCNDNHINQNMSENNMETDDVRREDYDRLKEDYDKVNQENQKFRRELEESRKKSGQTKKPKNKNPRQLNIPVPIRSLLTSPGVPGRITAGNFIEYVKSEECDFRKDITGEVSLDEKTGKILGLNEIASSQLEDSRERAKLVAGAQAIKTLFSRELEIDNRVNAALQEVLSGSRKTETQSLNAKEVSTLVNKTLKGTLIAEINHTIINNVAANEECMAEVQKSQQMGARNLGFIVENDRRIKNLENNTNTAKDKKENLNMILDEPEKEHRLVIRGHLDVAKIRDMDPEQKKEKICQDLSYMDTDDHKINPEQIRAVFVSGNRQRNRDKGIVTVRFHNCYKGLSYKYISNFKKRYSETGPPFDDIVEYRTLSERKQEGIYYKMVDEVAIETEKIIKEEFKDHMGCTLALQNKAEEVARIMMKYDLRVVFRNGPHGSSTGPYIKTIPKPKDASGGKFSTYTSQVKKSLLATIGSLKRMEKRRELSRREGRTNNQAEDSVDMGDPNA